MRHIPKPERGEEPAQFSRWKRGHPGAKYSSLHNARVKAALKESFIKRQKYICCYCETRVSFDNSHIEHIEPQLGGLSEKTLEYSNMAVSCIKDPKKFESPDDPSGIGIVRDGWLHCGHARGTLPAVSPYDERCERLFAYSFSGEIKVNPDLDDAEEIRLARETIDNLRLNVPTLVSLRNLVMFECVKALDRGVSAEAILREINGRLPPFVSSAAAAAAAFASKGNL
ncbi:MAG: TIGR02646 family protein [Opitutales bacterium]|nr:TIGR02646 family protein [Opitutales bacterium]